MNEFSHCPTEGAIGLLSLLIQSGRLAEARLDCALAEANLTFVKWRALDALIKSEAPMGLKLLPGELHCVKSNVTQLVDKLESDRLVRRIPDTEDRRGTLVELTDSGREAHAAGLRALQDATARLFGPFAEDDRDALRSLLSRLDG